MKQYTVKHVLGNFSEWQIDEEKYLELSKALEVLTRAYVFEEQYDLLTGNYSEFEKAIMEAVIDGIVFYRAGYLNYHVVRGQFHRRIINLLTSTKLYRDRASSHVKVMSYGDTSKAEADYLFSRMYDENIEFRFMEAYRNHVQHQAIRIDRLVTGGDVLDHENGSEEHSLYMGISKETLAQHSKFKKSVLAELPDQIDLMGYIRKYLSCIAYFHQFGRDRAREPVKAAREALSSCVTEFCSRSGAIPPGIYLVVTESGKITSQNALTLEWDDVRMELEKRNHYRPNLEKNYATGKTKQLINS